jgi:hypothetical protein
VRPDVDATGVAVILAMPNSFADRPLAAGVPEPARRYLSLVLAGLRPNSAPLSGRQPTEAEMHAAFAKKVRAAVVRQRAVVTGPPARTG